MISLKFMIITLCIFLISFAYGKDLRKKYSINNNEWKFKRADVKGAKEISFDDSGWLSIKIPHDFNGGIDGVHNDVFLGRKKSPRSKNGMYKGPAWYRTVLEFSDEIKGKRIFIEFEAVSLVSEVYVNGSFVGEHKGGYTAFEFDITDYINSENKNVIAVKADNSNNPSVAPWMFNPRKSFPYSFDYAVYGGIYRDVWISINDPVRIEKVFNNASCGGQAPAMLFIDTQVKNYSNKTEKVSLKSVILNPEGKQVAELIDEIEVTANNEEYFSQSHSSFGNVKFWSPENPNVYKVVSTISYNENEVDNYESVFGFRYYTLAKGQAFELNGEKKLIRGINRHQDMEGYGYALPNEQHWKDAKLIKDAGFNFVRHAHYPSDKEFTKACDELGLLMWLELPLTGSTSKEPEFLRNCKQQLTEMIEQHYNNPSVILWSIGNESDRSGANENTTNNIFSELVDLAKELDPDRPVTGCNFKYESNQNIVDIYSPQDWNGWYGGAIDWYKPTSIIGEYGGDIDYTNHSEENFDISKEHLPASNPQIWSQEYGCFLHEYKISYAEEYADSFPGHCVWLAFDFASPRVDRGMNPIPYMNQKGLILHDHKTKKDAYYLYQSMYRKAEDYPMVYIVSESWADRWKSSGSKNIWIYSNCDSVKLYNDFEKDIDFGSRRKINGPRGDTRFQWDSIYVEENVLYAEGFLNNNVVAKDTLIIKK